MADETKPDTEVKIEIEEELDDNSPLEVFIDHQRKAAVEAGKALEGLIPAAVREHGSQAFREMVGIQPVYK